VNTIPVLPKRLGDESEGIRRKTAELVGKLSTQCECQLKTRCSTADSEYEAEFREAVGGMILSSITALDDESWYARSQAIMLISELANHGERQLNTLGHS
jgi:hypothetical protein